MEFNEEESKARLDRLIHEGTAGLSEAEVIRRLEMLVDVSYDLSCSKGTDVALKWGEEFELKVSSARAARLDYILSNAWANRYQERTEKTISGWEQPEFQKQIFYLKRAIGREEFNELPSFEQCQILTNLGNCLSTIGRFVEAQHAWRRALEVVPKFGMALGNRGFGARFYLNALYDPGHRKLFGLYAFSQLRAALQPDAVFCDSGANLARDGYLASLREVDELLGDSSRDLNEYLSRKGFSMGRSKIERDYRSWCLSNRLFLNPLNDLFDHAIASRDALSTPSITCSVSQKGPPPAIGFFNQMKQEFVSARWSFYSGSTRTTPHFSDREVLFPNTLDYASLCLGVEETKSAFRSAYSLFDKIAFFINQYFDLGVPDNKVWFRKIWFDSKKKTVREDLGGSENWALRGLFWLSKDFFDEAHEASDPDAQELAEVRNHLEHKFLRIHEFDSHGNSFRSQEGLGLSISRARFQDLTLHLLSLSRCALIYLSLAVENEERRRSRDGLTMPIVMTTIDDKWKV